jgi:hypothetical protein
MSIPFHQDIYSCVVPGGEMALTAQFLTWYGVRAQLTDDTTADDVASRGGSGRLPAESRRSGRADRPVCTPALVLVAAFLSVYGVSPTKPSSARNMRIEVG